MDRGYILSEEDRGVLLDMIKREMERSRSTPNRSSNDRTDHEEIFPPEVYVAYTPLLGIPGMTFRSVTGTGTRAGTGTGTGTRGPWPGHAQCDIYHAVPDADDVLELVSMGFNQVVYNLSETPIPGATWVLTWRDKPGTWFAEAPVTGGFVEIWLPTDICPIGAVTGTGTAAGPIV
jgi:hypothetical protein